MPSVQRARELKLDAAWLDGGDGVLLFCPRFGGVLINHSSPSEQFNVLLALFRKYIIFDRRFDCRQLRGSG